METITFKQLINDNRDKLADIDCELLSLFENHYENDDAENLESCDIYDKLDYSGSIHELVDGKIDIYYHDLRIWSIDNYSYVEDAMDEGLCEGVTDFHKLIQVGQYVYYRDQMNSEIESLTELINELVDQYEDQGV